jgi:hypothetical protein
MNSELKFGIISGITFCLCVLLEFFSGIHNSKMEVAQYTEMIAGFIPWIFIFIGIRYRKTMIQNGKLTFGEGVRAGMIISLISSIIISTFLYLYVNLINTGYNNAKLAFLNAQLVNAKLPPEILKQQMAGNASMYSGSFGSHLSLMVMFASIGIVISAIISLLLRSKTPPDAAI